MKKKVYTQSKKRRTATDDFNGISEALGIKSLEDMTKPPEFGTEDALIAVKIVLGLLH